MTSFSITPRRRELPQYNPAGIGGFAQEGGDFQLVVSESALSAVRRHAGLSRRREIGGILVGRHFKTDGRYLVHVQDHVAVPSNSSGVVHFEFDERSIQAILAHLDERPEQYVVGWYHSHPGGPPFMSELDLRLHANHFAEPWHVSCVVSAGTWGRPAGFWRMCDGELQPIDEYSLAMSMSEDLTASHAGFLAALGLRKRDDETPAPDLLSLLPVLGVAGEGALSRAVAQVASGGTESEGLADAHFLVAAAMAAAADSQAVDELTELRSRIERLRLFNDVATPVLISGLLDERIYVGAGECYTYSEKKPALKWIDLTDASSFTAQIPSPPQCMAHGPDGAAWMVTRSNRLVRLGRVSAAVRKTGKSSFPDASAELPHLPERPAEMVIVDGAVWLRSRASWHEVELPSASGEVRFGKVRSGPLPAAQSCLVAGNGFAPAGAAPDLVGNDEGKLRSWRFEGGEWVPTGVSALPDPWSTGRLVQAALGGAGLYLLFEKDATRHLLLFDRETLGLMYCLVRTADEESTLELTGLSGDGSGRMFVRTGGVLFRV